MIPVGLAASAVVLMTAAGLRAGAASLVWTPRADALLDGAEGDRRAARVAALLDEQTSLQPAIGVVHSILMVTAALPASWVLSGRLSGGRLLAGFFVLALVIVLVGEVIPRSYGRRRPRRLAYRFSRLLSVSVKVGRKASDVVTELDELEETEQGSDQNEADRDEIELISSVLEFSDTIVREVMVPRTDMISIDGDLTSEDVLDLVIECGFSRIPVEGDGVDDIIGMVYAKDLLRLMDQRSDPVAVTDLMREVFFIPETKAVSHLLREMQSSQFHLAVVVDEFGGTAGIVTIEDLLEELVGEIVDEYDTEVSMVENLGGGQYLVDARMSVDDLNDLLGTDLPDDEWDTVGGLVLGLAGRVPREGEQFDFDGAHLVPERVQGRRVERVRVGLRGKAGVG